MSLYRNEQLPHQYAQSSLAKVLTWGNRYNTRSNKVRVIKTPGGELRYLHIKKKGSPPKCGDCGIKLPGVGFPSCLESDSQLGPLLCPAILIPDEMKSQLGCHDDEIDLGHIE